MKTLTVNGQQYTIEDPDGVSYGESQSLTDEQKATARANIGAAAKGDGTTIEVSTQEYVGADLRRGTQINISTKEVEDGLATMNMQKVVVYNGENGDTITSAEVTVLDADSAPTAELVAPTPGAKEKILKLGIPTVDIKPLDAQVGRLEKTVFGGNIDAAHTNFVKASANLFDYRRVQVDRLIETNGQYADKAIYSCSHPIPVKKGKKYRFNDATNYCFAYCDAEGNILEAGRTTRETIDGAQYMVLTADRDGFVVVNSNKTSYKTFMFCQYDAYPSEYVPYLLTIHERDVEYQADSKKLLHDMGIYTPQNMFDKSAVTTNAMLDGGKLKEHSMNTVSDYIEVVRGVKYAFMFNSQTYGSGFAGAVEAYDSDKQYIGYKEADGIVWHVKPTEYSLRSIGVISCEDPDIKYIRITNYKGSLDEVMVVEGDTYPQEYREYGYTLDNSFRLNDTQKAELAKRGAVSPLFGKIAVFDGDSFGSGSSAKDGRNGWAGRIGAGNSMIWKNYAVGGGTIRQKEGSHFIGDMDAIIAAYPKLDYLILEGGANDATTFGEAGLGAFGAADYSGSYDTHTFSGAFETMLYKAVTYYPTAKIGYIVAHNINDSIYRTYFDRAVELCKKWGIPYIDLWYGAHLNKRLAAHYDSGLGEQGNIDAGKLYTDGKHLTPAGYEVITPKIEAWMKTL